MAQKVLTRRDLLKVMVGAASLGTGQELFGKEEKKPARVKVVLVRDPNVLDRRGQINVKVLQKMLDEAVTTLVGEKDPVAAWKQLVKPTDLVGIKTNVWSPLPTPREVEDAIQGRLRDAGVKPERIRIDDRGARTTLSPCTALINVRPLRTHWWSGIGGCIKNYIMFAPRPEEYHTDACTPLAAVWQLPAVKGKTRLNILLALTPLFHGRGPHHYDPRFVWSYRGLFVSFDPVAIDSVGLRLIQAKRLQFFGEEVKLETPAHHIIAADKKYNLGVSDPARIQLIKLGWKEEVLL
ncbi:MAG: DUF362 domain-containing protein [Armatimonadetes bacterium]|nr:DUF362 domain-containing protein [Armatimonadota bacterium]MDW8121751.1 DUF362 domain-containing protein [Armatimonadota bacterium]